MAIPLAIPETKCILSCRLGVLPLPPQRRFRCHMIEEEIEMVGFLIVLLAGTHHRAFYDSHEPAVERAKVPVQRAMEVDAIKLQKPVQARVDPTIDQQRHR